jgi:SAM-dependent methyltransferase
MLHGVLRTDLIQVYPDFFHRYPELTDETFLSKRDSIIVQKQKTIDRFGYEWTHFDDYDCNNFEAFVNPLPVNFLKGKLGLDIGCGAGRHARQASERGAEIVCVDLSESVDIAYKNNAENAFVHVVQGDVYNLPFKTGNFQFIYSLGVLHHLTEPERGYQTLIPFLREGGALFIWLYAYAPRKIALETLRSVSQKLSNNNIRRMAYICNLIDYGIFVNMYHLMCNLPVLGKLINRDTFIRFREYKGYGFRVGYIDWFDRLSAPITNFYKKSEVRKWLTRSGLSDTKLLPVGDSWWWLYGERKA